MNDHPLLLIAISPINKYNEQMHVNRNRHVIYRWWIVYQLTIIYLSARELWNCCFVSIESSKLLYPVIQLVSTDTLIPQCQRDC